MPVEPGPLTGELLFIGPEGGRDFWQPVPANGHVSVRISPAAATMENPFALGTQTVPPGCYVREHSHDRCDEALHFISGAGRAVIDRTEYPIRPGTTVFIGRNRLHMFINDGGEDLHWVWLVVPNGLEDFFEEIGRARRPDEPPPEPFPRPQNVLEIERRTAFAPPPDDGGKLP